LQRFEPAARYHAEDERPADHLVLVAV